MARISFNIAAKCDKAGRSQNQDNYWLCPDLSKINDSYESVIGKDRDVVLSEKGALLVVADGMGGMNAGEKASELVIKGVQNGFSNIPDNILGNDEEMLSFIRDVIVESDKSVKEYAKAHHEAEGLGSTIVLLWLWGEKAYCGWCGDSRIYRYNPNNELVRLSHDHSYVQELVDNRKIEPEDAFDHPDGNIVTRALGDNGEKADPELMAYDICERDVFLLCSDGLCGLLQDKQIEEIISLNCSSTKDALTALWQAGDSTGWSDNATIELLCVVEGGKHPRGVAVGYPDKRKPIETKNAKTTEHDIQEQEQTNEGIERFLKPPYLYIIAAIALLFLGFVLLRHCSSNPEPEKPEKPGKQNEFIVTEPIPGSQQGGQQGSQHGGQQGSQHGGQQGSQQGGQQGSQQGGQQGSQQGGQQGSQQGGQQGTQQGGQQGGHQGGQQGGSEQIQTVSEDYIKMLNGVYYNDYPIVKTLWNQVKLNDFMTTDESTKMDDFVSNVQQLKNNPDYAILDARTRQIIDNQMIPLSEDIKANKRYIHIINVSPNNGPRPSIQNNPYRRTRPQL